MTSAIAPLATPAESVSNRASGSSFYTAMRILPPGQRDALTCGESQVGLGRRNDSGDAAGVDD